MTEADFLVDAVLGRGLAHIVQDVRSIGNSLRFRPRLEGIAQREHVAVGTNAGIAEQVPSAADAVATLQDDEALARAFRLEVIARADTGQTGADDQNVEMFCCQRALLRPCRHNALHSSCAEESYCCASCLPHGSRAQPYLQCNPAATPRATGA